MLNGKIRKYRVKWKAVYRRFSSTPAYVQLAADVVLAVVVPALSYSFLDKKVTRKPPKPIASVVRHNNKKNKNGVSTTT
jgi:hypothetical protein